MSSSVLVCGDVSTLQYIVTHVFSPLKLPDGDDHSLANDRSLAAAVATVAHLYNQKTTPANIPLWKSIPEMLNNLYTVVPFQHLDESKVTAQFAGMNVGGVLAFMIRAQNAGVVLRKQADVTVFESFELSPKAEDVMTSQGKLICSYPGPAIEIPNITFDDKNFRSELANFLVQMSKDILQDAAAATRKAQSTVQETRDTTHPRYITELLTGILRSVGHPADIVRISKRVGDDVVWNNSKLPWRRSSLWLLIRVVLQTTLDRTSLGRVAYKEFMLFFMCQVGSEGGCEDLSNDLLQCIATKISRRLRKLGSSAPEWLSRLALETCTTLRSVLEKRWIRTQDLQGLSPPWTPSMLDMSRDTQLSLVNSGDYIQSRLAGKITGPFSANFTPRHRSRGCLDDFLSSDGSFFVEAYRDEPHITLYDVEQAVEEGIDGWVDRVTNNNGACVKLEVLANKYSSSALKSYENNPELLSVMLLTVVELWVALDKIAIREIPMLGEYSPEVPTSLLEGLLVCKAASLQRLRLAHQYLSRRHSQSHRGSVFSSEGNSDGFAIRYFNGSPHLQLLKGRIEDVARHEVHKKIAELDKANAEHEELRQQAARIDHTYWTDWYGSERHDRYCRKCDLGVQQQRIQIDVHEWPLPACEYWAGVVVFELDCPVSFNMWRTATFHLLIDLCSPPSEPQEPYIRLDQYHALLPYLIRHPRSRITLGSDAKPFVASHYRSSSVPATRDSVCVPNGLNFYGYDSCARVAVSNAHGRVHVSKYCTYRLEGEPYRNLQKYVDATSHTSNEVMANQADCHRELSLHEFLAFGHLRSGGSIQWLNTLRELRGRSLTFHRPEVHSLIAQAVSQAGPLGNVGWTWHQEIKQPSFCHAVLGELTVLLRDIEVNWLEVTTMDTISLLIRRLLASGPEDAVLLKAVELLRTVRGKVFKWVKELSAKLKESPGDGDFHGFLRDSAIVCRSTFNVDLFQIPNLLSSAHDIDILLFCAILIHDHTPSKVSSIPAYSQLLLDRDHRLSLILERFISNLVQGDSSDAGINSAISRVWPDYRPGSKWKPESLNSCWFSCTTSPTAEQSSQKVHLNILDGLLLVDGKPLGRLPTKITQHPTYNLIFGEQVLDVIPGDIPGMDYATRGEISDHRVYFSLTNDSDLVIKAKPTQKPNDSQIIELVPPEKLKGDLSAVLVEGYTHWLNLSTSVIEIRPLSKIWETSTENWKIDCTPGLPYRMHKGSEILIDVHSASWVMVSNLLKPLDTPSNLVISLSSNDSDRGFPSLRLSVALPRYGLSFYVDEDGDLQSHDMRGMVYDKNQCIGTLFGLVNRLVLRPKVKDVDVIDLIPRQVIVPEGEISFRKVDHHVCVDINTQRPTLDRVTFQTYKVNRDLGCLATVGLTNRLYLAYLHALTSGCSTDPLTGRSGTEEALSLLHSASSWSVMKFSDRDAELLGLIASLCPSRTWYPVHLNCMQRVEWLDLPANSQYHELFVVSQAIRTHYQRLERFHETQPSNAFQKFPLREDHLLERSALRAAYLFPSEFSGQPSRTNCRDVRYRARDLVDSGEHRAHAAATTVYIRAPSAVITKDILKMVESWKEDVSGDAYLSLQYNRSWLAPKLSLIWLKAYGLLRRSDEGKWFQMLFSLPAMAYTLPELADLVPVFVAFASQLQFLFENPPSYSSYAISRGYQPLRATLCNYISNSAYSFECSPESSGSSRQNESISDMRQRQRGMYDSRLNSDINTTVDHLLRAWPCETPPGCSLNRSLYDVSSLTSHVQDYFSSCYHNLKLKEHLERVQDILRGTRASPAPALRYSFEPSQSILSPNPWTLEQQQLFSRPEPSLPALVRLSRYVAHDVRNPSSSGSTRLRPPITVAGESAVNPFQGRYVSALHTSAKCFDNESSRVSNRSLYDVSSLTSRVQDYLSSCYHNLRLKERLERVQEILRGTQVFPAPSLRYSFEPLQSVLSPNPWTLEEQQLFSRPGPSLPAQVMLSRYVAHDVRHPSSSGSTRLRQLITVAGESAVNLFQRRYVSALRTSAECFDNESSRVSCTEETELPDTKTLEAHYTRCRADYVEGLRRLRQYLAPRSLSEEALQQSGQWPRITSYALLRFFASNSPITISDNLKRCLIQFVLLALQLQRARRLLRLHLNGQQEELRRELQNEGCDGWNAEAHPDWLLVQLQGNFFVRRIQSEVAYEMISPSSGDNTTMQLNMGEGKSSVIVPIVVAELANGEQLVRVIVPKALTAQMFHLLVDRLGGLTNRRIYFLPFSRSLGVDGQKAAALHELMMECMEQHGILVVQPEHVLSLKLVSVEKQLPGEEDDQVGLRLLELQRWLHSRSRDILDENDEILHVRYQLVYTIGNQQPMEGSPERWTTTQQILDLVNKHASSIRELYPLGVEYERNQPGAFPHLRILHPDAGQKLIACIMKDINDDHLPNFSFGRLRSDLRDAIQIFISCEEVPEETVQLVKGYFKESTLWGGLLLLRGLLATGILLFAFRERRWRVDYGLALARTMLAVPYRAKDVPAQRAEFGHPDVAIILTCLSYYYGGLDEKQLRTSFNILLQQDEPSADYDLWVRECPTVPDNLRTLNAINLKSSEQWHELLFPLFSKNKATVDFYLSRVVFPKEAKEFPLKLSCSGWDLAEKRERLVTGFSGTNDGQYLLPQHITQCDPDHQRGTNAKVLSYLLQSENNHYTCMSHENGERRSTEEFLQILASQESEIRVLLDVGAQMLELENRQLAKTWLDIKQEASAAIYFNEDDELTVITRDGHTQLLRSSPFGQQLDQCVIYLDDAHTRGTDVKFPVGFRAAVTLGPKVTKDRLVQGCMRMRKLGHGHSITFFAPLEIDRRIRSVASKHTEDNIDTLDILHWAIRETCDDIQQRAPHWILQGTDHSSRYIVWSAFCKGQLTPHELSGEWLQPESKSLEDLYGPDNASKHSLMVPPNIRERCEELGIYSQRNASMDEEQEREVIHEAERERQVERPLRIPPAIHSIHHDVASFVKTGIIPANSSAFHPAFETLHTTTAAIKEAHVWSSRVLVTTDFQRTIESQEGVDDYLRPAQWIISGGRAQEEVLVILSPHEANLLIADIRSGNNVHLHLYTPRVIRSMKPCDDLTLYSIPSVSADWIAPSLLMDQLNVFAGQLYLKDYETYIRLRHFFCVYTRELGGDKGVDVGCDGFIELGNRPAPLQTLHSFQSSPVKSVKTLMGIRRKGMQFSLTHMGKLLDGRLLSEDDFLEGDDNVFRANNYSPGLKVDVDTP